MRSAKRTPLRGVAVGGVCSVVLLVGCGAASKHAGTSSAPAPAVAAATATTPTGSTSGPHRRAPSACSPPACTSTVCSFRAHTAHMSCDSRPSTAGRPPTGPRSGRACIGCGQRTNIEEGSRLDARAPHTGGHTEAKRETRRHARAGDGGVQTFHGVHARTWHHGLPRARRRWIQHETHPPRFELAAVQGGRSCVRSLLAGN